MRTSILLPIGATRPEQTITFANMVKWTAADRLWQGQATVLDGHHLISWLAGAGIRVPCGFGVSLMPFRSPFQAAMEARSVALATGESVIAGFGPGATSLQAGMLGRPYKSQLGACREYLRAVRDLLNGDMAEIDGDDYSVTARLPDYHRPPVSVGLGVLREKAAELAGELADVAITWLGSAEYVGKTLLPAMRRAPHRVPDEPVRVTAVVPVALSGPGRDAHDLATASCGIHLTQPHYQDTLRGAGIELTGDEKKDAGLLLDGGVFQYGTPAEVAAGLREYAAMGVDEVVLNTTGVARLLGPRAAARDLLAVLEATEKEQQEDSG
ncbi:LLM class flavin-dependent oxidoreductase [Streptomyces boninensis]|uniref:LLM class flavin-dependent oxidoreductase n=1 Tax=Streptomyces boninensis TaxID=2039455 RepID=UPI003B211990